MPDCPPDGGGYICIADFYTTTVQEWAGVGYVPPHSDKEHRVGIIVTQRMIDHCKERICARSYVYEGGGIGVHAGAQNADGAAVDFERIGPGSAIDVELGARAASADADVSGSALNQIDVSAVGIEGQGGSRATAAGHNLVIIDYDVGKSGLADDDVAAAGRFCV